MGKKIIFILAILLSVNLVSGQARKYYISFINRKNPNQSIAISLENVRQFGFINISAEIEGQENHWFNIDSLGIYSVEYSTFNADGSVTAAPNKLIEKFNSFSGVSIVVDKLSSVSLSYFICDNIFQESFGEDTADFYVSQCKSNFILIDNATFLNITHSEVDSLRLNRLESKPYFDDVDINALTITSSTLPGILLNGCIDNLTLDQVNFSFGASLEISPQGNRVGLVLSNSNIELLDFDYNNFFLKPSLFKSRPFKLLAAYEQIFDHQGKKGHYSGKELVDKERIRYENFSSGNLGKFKDNLSEWWWDYGYNKELIFRNSIYLMLGFYLLNLIFYKKLVTLTYPIESFTNEFNRLSTNYSRYHPMRIFSWIFQTLLYTGAIFWGIKLSVERLSVRNIPLAFLVVLQYIAGIICLAYIANYIIVKS